MNTEQAVERMTDAIRRKHFALNTEHSYCAWLKRYCDYVKKLPALMPSEQKLERFLTELARNDVAASTQNQAFNAILFFYKEALGLELKNVQALRARRPSQVRRAPTREETYWNWAWVFPAHQPCADPRTGKLVRWRFHEANIQRAIRKACRKTGLLILPHELRHAYATHCLNRGANPRAIQEVMGHKSLETTMGYMHAEALGVASPLDP